jgi:hypothetical protein
VNERQKTAMRFTCKLPEETAHPRFARLHLPTSSVLTLNSGFE